MPRHRRTWTAGAGAHIISRFVDRRFIIEDDDDRRSLLSAIAKADHRWDWTWLSFALMSNHVHYGTVATERSPDGFFHSAHTRFAQHFHRRHDDTLGPVFADRPKLLPVAPGGLLRLVAYHHRNPKRAGVVARPSESRWTSHRAYLRLDPAPAFLNVERALALLKFEDTAAGRQRFDDAVMDVDITQIAQAPKPDTQRTSSPVDWERLLALSCRSADLQDRSKLASKTPAAVAARLLAATVAIRDLGQSRRDVAQRIGITAGSLSNLLSRKGASSANQEARTKLVARYFSHRSDALDRGENDE